MSAKKFTKHAVKFLKRKKKGSTMIEAVLGTMVFLIIFMAVMDMIVVSHRYTMLTDTVKEFTRTLSVQGGALDVKPAGFASNYYTISDLAAMVKKNMDNAGYRAGEWNVVIEYTRYYDPSTNTITDYDGTQTILGFDSSNNYFYDPTLDIDYLSNFTVTIRGQYRWNFLKYFIGSKTTTLLVSMPGISEFKYNYDYWPGEI